MSEHLKATPQEGRRSPGKHPASEEGPQRSTGSEALGSRFFWPMEFPCRFTPFTYSFCQFPDTNPMLSTEDTLVLKKISFHEGGELKVGGGSGPSDEARSTFVEVQKRKSSKLGHQGRLPAEGGI